MNKGVNIAGLLKDAIKFHSYPKQFPVIKAQGRGFRSPKAPREIAVRRACVGALSKKNKGKISMMLIHEGWKKRRIFRSLKHT